MSFYVTKLLNVHLFIYLFFYLYLVFFNCLRMFCNSVQVSGDDCTPHWRCTTRTENIIRGVVWRGLESALHPPPLPTHQTPLSPKFCNKRNITRKKVFLSRLYVIVTPEHLSVSIIAACDGHICV